MVFERKQRLKSNLSKICYLFHKGKGSGAYGSITSRDLGSLSSGGGSTPAAPIPTGAAYIDIPVSNTRAIIAKRLLESKVTIPHYYLTVDVNVDKV